jgi:DNA-binding transcriptional MerR regulator
MRYTVKQLAKMAGITVRTLHYYDQIGLLRPASYGENGYRYYDDDDALRLQQILFFRELDFSLDEIKSAMDRPGFDLQQALTGHKKALQKRIERTNRLITTIDRTIDHLQGANQMSSQDYYSGFDEEQQQQHFEEAQQRWGDSVAQSKKRWNNSSREEKNWFLAQMHEISSGIAAEMDKGPASPEVQYWIDRWYKHIDQQIFSCTLETFEALGHMYVQDPAFTATYEKVKPGMAEFMEAAMVHYVRAAGSQ